jgi:uncharacterized membrane protein
MRNFVTVIFDRPSKAYDAQRALWDLDGESAVTVHGTGIVHRDGIGQLIVDSDESLPPFLATAIGAGMGALLGAIAGPAGSALGIAGASAIGSGAGAAAGAGLGASGGLVGDVLREDVEEQAGYETSFVLRNGEYALIADVTEDWTTPIDEELGRFGGRIYRRPRSEVRDDAASYPFAWDGYLYPYEYRPEMYQAA